MDNVLLLQNFSHFIAHAQARSKPFMISQLIIMVERMYDTRQQLVIKHAVPAAFSVLNEGKVVNRP